MVGRQIAQRLIRTYRKQPLQTTLDDKNTHIFTDTERNTTLQKNNYKQKYRNTRKQSNGIRGTGTKDMSERTTTDQVTTP